VCVYVLVYVLVFVWVCSFSKCADIAKHTFPWLSLHNTAQHVLDMFGVVALGARARYVILRSVCAFVGLRPGTLRGSQA
jgi:hypothetical protein